MNILAIDSTTDKLVVCAEINGVYAEKISEDCLKKHNALIIPYVDEVLAQLGARLGDVDVFAATAGPGSFMGIRVGVSTVKAFSLALGKPVVAVDALALIGYGITGRFMTAIDARNDNYYAAMFSDGWQNVEWEKSVTKSELLSYNVSVTYQSLPVSGRNLIAIARSRAEKGLFESNLSPVYLKKSQAERMKDGE